MTTGLVRLGAPTSWVRLTAAASIIMLLAACGGDESSGDASSGENASASAGAAGSTGDAASSAASTLAGTAWRFVEFQSMDNAQGARRPADPSQFTMRLNADGTVNMQLDCNRANGSWSATPSSDPTNGSFEFGPLATTKALCPPPQLDEFIAAQAQYVRGYAMRDGRLALSLMADGGTMLWEPLADESMLGSAPDPVIEAAIRDAVPDYAASSGDPERYAYARLDLNGDGAQEVLVYLMGPTFCGTGGCTMLLFTPGENAPRLVNTFAITQTPVYASPERVNGWQTLWRTEAGGGAPRSHVQHTFDGSRYVEGQRTSGDVLPSGRRVLSEDLSFEQGFPLPRR